MIFKWLSERFIVPTVKEKKRTWKKNSY